MNTFTKIMLSEAEKHLIDIAEEEEGINEALSGIRAFRLSVLGSFTKSTLDELESKGFDFRSKGITSRRAELRVFVESHNRRAQGEDILHAHTEGRRKDISKAAHREDEAEEAEEGRR